MTDLCVCVYRSEYLFVDLKKNLKKNLPMEKKKQKKTDAHTTTTHSTYMMKLTYYQYTYTYNFMHQKPDRKHNTPLHKLTIHPHTHRLKKQTTFNYTDQHRHTPRHSHTTDLSKLKIHTSIVQTHLIQLNHNKLIHHAQKISPSEFTLPRETRHTLAQLRIIGLSDPSTATCRRGRLTTTMLLKIDSS